MKGGTLTGVPATQAPPRRAPLRRRLHSRRAVVLLLFVFLAAGVSLLLPGRGLLGSYFAGTGFDRPLFERIDRQIYFSDLDSPFPSDLPQQGFSVRWTGQLEAPRPGLFVLATKSDDGLRMWLDGKLVIDDWTEHAEKSNRASLELSGGWHDFRIEYYQKAGTASVKLFWAQPGGPLELIPSWNLSPAPGGAASVARFRVFPLLWFVLPAVTASMFAFFFLNTCWTEPVSPILSPCLIGISCCAAGVGLTNGSCDWLQAAGAVDVFDHLAARLAQGRVDLDAGVIGSEAFYSGGRAVAYFGPFPALLRLVANTLVPSNYGRWNALSCFIAYSLALVAAVAYVRQCVASSPWLSPRMKRVALLLATAGLGLGCPLLVVTHGASIYHEAILWGLAAALWGLYFSSVSSTNSAPRRPIRLGMAIASSVAVLSRPTFAIPLVGLLLLEAVRGFQALRAEKALRWRTCCLSLNQQKWDLLILSSTAAFVAWYNHARFGSFFSMYPIASYGYFHDPVAQPPPRTFDLSRVWYGLSAYFGGLQQWAAHRFAANLLFSRSATDFSLGSFGAEPMPSLTLMCPWLVAVLVAGIPCAVATDCSRRKVLTALLLLQCLLVLSYYYRTTRFSAEFVPLAVFLGGELLTARPLRSLSPNVKYAVMATTTVLVGWSVAATGFCTLHIPG